MNVSVAIGYWRQETNSKLHFASDEEMDTRIQCEPRLLVSLLFSLAAIDRFCRCQWFGFWNCEKRKYREKRRASIKWFISSWKCAFPSNIWLVLLDLLFQFSKREKKNRNSFALSSTSTSGTWTIHNWSMGFCTSAIIYILRIKSDFDSVVGCRWDGFSLPWRITSADQVIQIRQCANGKIKIRALKINGRIIES